MKRRNILWLTMDHVTFHQLRCLGGAHPVLSTYDMLCREGYQFDQCKSVHPLCLPCRASMLTGLYPHHHGHERNKPFEDAVKPGNPMQLLKENGYQLAYFGKNHSGYEDITEFGFEGWAPPSYGNPYRSEAYAQFLKENGYEHPLYHQQWHMRPTRLGFSGFTDDVHDLTQEDDFNQNNAGYLENSQPVHESDFLVWMAEKWLRTHADQPFVLRVDTWGPHHAYQPPLSACAMVDESKIELPPSLRMDCSQRPKFSQRFLKHCVDDMPSRDDATFRMLLHRAYAQYTYIDQAFGRLIAFLKEMGVEKDTAIIMTADHGDALATAGGLFDKSGDLQEELMDIPMVVYDPWSKTPHKVESLTSNLDVAPTVLDLAGIPVPENLDGRSLLALAEGRISPRERLMCEHYGHFNTYSLQRAIYEGDYKYIATQDDLEQLYAIKDDPFEMHNLANEPQYAEVLKHMRDILAQERARTGDTQTHYEKEEA